MAERLQDTSAHPNVAQLHATLDEIERLSTDNGHLSQLVADRSIVDRNRRKMLERRAKVLIPDSNINPDDTGNFQLKVV